MFFLFRNLITVCILLLLAACGGGGDSGGGSSNTNGSNSSGGTDTGGTTGGGTGGTTGGGSGSVATGPSYSFSVEVGESDLPGTRAVTITVSGVENHDITALRNLCVDGLNEMFDTGSDITHVTESPTYCLTEATRQGDDYVKTINVPYGTYTVSLLEVYRALNRDQVRTLATPAPQGVQVSGPAVRTRFHTALPASFPQITTTIRRYISADDITLTWMSGSTSSAIRNAYYYNRLTGQTLTRNWSAYYPTVTMIALPYKSSVYEVRDYDSWPQRALVIERMNLLNSAVTQYSNPYHSECKEKMYVETDIGSHTFRIDSELRGLYTCVNTLVANTRYEHLLVAWRFDMDTDTMISQEVLYRYSDASPSSTHPHYYQGAFDSVTVDKRRFRDYFYLLPAGLYDLRSLSYDTCYDPSRNSLFSSTDPDTGATRCIVLDTAVNKPCVESPLMDGSCDASVNHRRYGVRAGIVNTNGEIWLSDGSVFIKGLVVADMQPATHIAATQSNYWNYMLNNISYDPLAMFNNSPTKNSPLQRYRSGSTNWHQYTNSEADPSTGEVSITYRDNNDKHFLSVLGVQEDVIPPGPVPYANSDSSNRRGFSFSDPDYRVIKSCAVWTYGGATVQCTDITSSSNFYMSQRQVGTVEEGSMLLVEGPAYDPGIREVAVASSSYGSQKLDPATLLLGVWQLQNVPNGGRVTISFTSNGTGVADINIPGYQVEKRAYTYLLSGTSVTFHYVGEPTPEPYSTIVSLTATDLSLRHPVTGTGNYKKL